MMLSVAWAALQSRAVPAWLAWAALAIAISMILPVIGDIAQLFLTLWVLVVAALALFRHWRCFDTRGG
jgi:hypothetical protein